MTSTAPKFSLNQKEIALTMWVDGFDTLDIAKVFGVPEGYVYSRLPMWRREG